MYLVPKLTFFVFQTFLFFMKKIFYVGQEWTPVDIFLNATHDTLLIVKFNTVFFFFFSFCRRQPSPCLYLQFPSGRFWCYPTATLPQDARMGTYGSSPLMKNAKRNLISWQALFLWPYFIHLSLISLIPLFRLFTKASSPNSSVLLKRSWRASKRLTFPVPQPCYPRARETVKPRW